MIADVFARFNYNEPLALAFVVGVVLICLGMAVSLHGETR